MNFIRTVIFNILFYGSILFGSVLMIPALVLPRRLCNQYLTAFFRYFAWLERHVLGLDYEVINKDILPKEGSFIIGAKHQSAHETLKFHLMLNDPAAILKKELTYLPIWGWIAYKLDNIAVNRKSRKIAMQSIIDGAKVAKSQGRPIFIFPQGTRTKVGETPSDVRYKWGIARMAKASKLDIYPMALNSGLFWGRNAFIKKPGKITFKFLPPISYKQSEAKIMEQLEKVLEAETNKLVAKARKEQNIS